MYVSVHQLRGTRVHAVDGDLGHIDDVYFDDEHWLVRYLVVTLGGWPIARKVLLTPPAVDGAGFQGRSIGVRLNCEQVRTSPDIDTHQPVSRRREADLARHYGYVPYWSLAAAGLIGWGPVPTGVPPMPPRSPPTPAEEGVMGAAEVPQTPEQILEESEAVHLRSAREVAGYHFQAIDRPIGHVVDLIIAPTDWAIAFLVIDTRDWLPGPRVLVPPSWIKSVSWAARSAFARVRCDRIEHSPRFDTDMLANPALQARYEEFRASPPN